MILSDEVLHDCLTGVMNEGRIPMYYLFSNDIKSDEVQSWLVASKYIKLKTEIRYISKHIMKDWVKKCPVQMKVPTLTIKGLWKIWTLRLANKVYNEDFVDYDEIRLK